MCIPLFLDSVKNMAKATYPLPSNREKGAVFLAHTCKVGLFALSIFETYGSLAVPYVGWIQLGLGAVSLICHIKTGNQAAKIKESLESTPIMILGVLEVSKVISVSKLGFSTFVSLTTTTSLYWLGGAVVVTCLPKILGKCMGSAEEIAKDNNESLSVYGAL